MTSSAWQIGAGAAVGLPVGSYLVTAVIRRLRAEQTTFGRSHCDRCGLQLGFASTLPLVSFAVLRGRCQGCGAPIDPIHLVGELGGAAVLAGACSLDSPARGAVMGLLGLALLAASVVDARTKRLPNLLTLVVAIAAAELSAGRSLSALIAGVTWAVGVVIVLQGLRLASERFGRDPGLGFGDAKLMGALAMWLGPLTPWMIAGGSALGLAAMLILRPKDGRLPFGPCVALAGWLVGFAVEQGLGR